MVRNVYYWQLWLPEFHRGKFSDNVEYIMVYFVVNYKIHNEELFFIVHKNTELLVIVHKITS